MTYLLVMMFSVFCCFADDKAASDAKQKIVKDLSHHTSSTYEEVQFMIESLKKSINKNDMDKFGDMIAYKIPAKWNSKKKIKNKKFFIKNAHKIVTDKVKKAILSTKDDLTDLFINSYGIMIGNGEIWFDPSRGGIIAINSLE
jgi:galactokinase/mevalonate kinase-like predicted kinase